MKEGRKKRSKKTYIGHNGTDGIGGIPQVHTLEAENPR
jgi:hypothetical protein